MGNIVTLNFPKQIVSGLDELNPLNHFATSKFGLGYPFFINGVTSDKTHFINTYSLDYLPSTIFQCPTCRRELKVHSKIPRSWKGLDDGNYEAYLKLDVPRVKCPQCGVHVVNIPWARPMSRFTNFLEYRILADVMDLSMSSVAERYSTTVPVISRIVNHYVESARQFLDLSDVSIIGLDEKSYKKGHKYILVMTDLVKLVVLSCSFGKDSEAVRAVMEDFKKHGGDPDKITDVALDMSPTLISAVREIFINAEITFDKFHLIAMANAVIDKVRRREVRDYNILKNSRWGLLKNPEKLTKNQEIMIVNISKQNLQTARAYRYKLALQKIMNSTLSRDEAEIELKKLIAWGVRTRVPEIIDFARSIRNHLAGILRYFESKITSGFVEAINGMIQEVNRRGRGYSNLKNFFNMIYLCLGGLKIKILPSTGMPKFIEGFQKPPPDTK
jgi:transposase